MALVPMGWSAEEIALANLQDEDWENNWKAYFKPLPVGDKLLIRPVWEDEYDADGRIVLDIEPGLAFGNGGHDTTRLCLETLEKYAEKGKTVLDVGCGGGFPSVPLAIMFPDVKFVSADSIGKKITVVKGVCEGAGIKNIDARNVRVEQIPEKFDYIVSRAVTEMPTFVKWIWGKIERGQRGTLPNGILYLKGGDLAEELAATRRRWTLFDISTMFEDEFFETKRVVYTKKE